MIDSLHIEHFMTFEKLDIPNLKRVNLIAGKNNAGKTALLEGLRILFFNGSDIVIDQILNDRGISKDNGSIGYDALFNRKSIQNLGPRFNIQINDLWILREPISANNLDFGYQYKVNKNLVPLGKEGFYQNSIEQAVYVPFSSEIEVINKLWNRISLTPKEDDVIKIIQETIEPQLVRFDVNSYGVKVRLADANEPVGLQTLGDGVQRILLIALSLANAQGKYLLIDELELGLHHSVIEKIWEMIFKYAKEWDIQIFVTTHSQDVINTFQYVTSREENNSEAAFIRLQVGRKGNHEAIIYDEERLSTSMELTLEIR